MHGTSEQGTLNIRNKDSPYIYHMSVLNFTLNIIMAFNALLSYFEPFHSISLISKISIQGNDYTS